MFLAYNRLYFIFLGIVLIFSSACSEVETLNLLPHNFNQRPSRIIWLQIAGLSEEHLALIKFGQDAGAKQLSFEKSRCMGKLWNYNLFKIRPSAKESFSSQMTGSKNIINSCQDYKKTSLWSLLQKRGYTNLLFESGIAPQHSLASYRQCKDLGEYAKPLKNIYFWTSYKKVKGAKSLPDAEFHYQNNKSIFRPGLIYADQSCSRRGCFSTLSANVKYLFNPYFESKKKFFAVIKDFSYYESLNRGNIKKAREILFEIEKSIQYIQEVSKKSGRVLILITSASVKNIELPKRGKEWVQYEKRGKNVLFKNNALISTVWAMGPSAENFCGIYEESEIYKRLIISTNKKINFDL